MESRDSQLQQQVAKVGEKKKKEQESKESNVCSRADLSLSFLRKYVVYITHDSVPSDSSLHLNSQIILRVHFFFILLLFAIYDLKHQLRSQPAGEPSAAIRARYYFLHYITFNARYALYELQCRRRVNADNSQNKRSDLSLPKKTNMSYQLEKSYRYHGRSLRYVCVYVCLCVYRSSSLLLAESRIDSQSIAKYGFFLFFFFSRTPMF